MSARLILHCQHYLTIIKDEVIAFRIESLSLYDPFSEVVAAMLM